MEVLFLSFWLFARALSRGIFDREGGFAGKLKMYPMPSRLLGFLFDEIRVI